MTEIIIFTISFIFIALASKQISGFFVKIKLPQITGFLIAGIIAGPFILDLIKKDAVVNLGFINDISLAFIAFAAGAELYLKELRSRYKSISWMTFGQLVVTFLLSTVIILFIADYIPFMKEMSFNVRFSVSMLISTIFVARSPASAIAVISEMRAKGPFTQTVMGVTVVKDVLVIILFALTFSISKTLIAGEKFSIFLIFLLLFEILISVGLGIIFSKIIAFALSLKISIKYKAVIVLIIGYGIFLFSKLTKHYSDILFNFEFYLEPLLISIIAGFAVINYTKYKEEFHKVLRDSEVAVYVVFFTLTGASVSIDVLIDSWLIALIFFFIRLFTMIIGSYIGGKAGGDPFKYWKFGWMPYVTQAGVGLGLVTVIAAEFTNWGTEVATVLISVIIMNQFIGPPLFKWVLHWVGESHTKSEAHEFDGNRDAIIFGLEDQATALARQLINHNWEVKIATRRKDISQYADSKLDIIQIKDFSLETMKSLQAEKAEAIVTMKTDKENLKICEIAYEHLGTKDVVVRLNDRNNFDKFHELGVLIVEPSTAIVSLLDHLVRSPVAASLLLGTEENQDTIDIEITNKDIHGLTLRELQLPCDILILSIKRKDNVVLSHGYTRLRLGDIITVVGSNESLDKVALRFEK
ncbi:MAG: cation:proton antiporter [Bacteroidales bacterium]|nr:cation:proton antiporter [Bacteroidales bacterium]